MSASRIAVAPQLCDQCGTCVTVCPGRRLRVGNGYIHVDSAACDGCLRCVRVCRTGALSERATRRPVAVTSADGAAKVVVGSRAEAKALRKQAEVAQRQAQYREKSRQRQATIAHDAERRRCTAAADGTVAWGTVDAVMVCLAFIATVVIERVALQSQAFALAPADAQPLLRAVILLALVVLRLGVLVTLANRRGSRLIPAFGLGRLGRGSAHMAGSVATVVSLVLVTLLFALARGMLARAIGWHPVVTTGLAEVFGPGGAGIALTVIVVVVFGPFVEELAFRGVVLSAAGERMGMWPAIAVSAGLFALTHTSVWAFMTALALGAACGYVAWRRCSLWSAVAVHSLYNGIVVAIALASR